MALNNLGLGFIFTARDQASATMARVGGAFDRQAARARMAGRVMQSAMVGIGASVATMAAGLATLRGAWSMAEASAEFGIGLARVGAVTRATAEEMALLRRRAIDAGIATQFSPYQAVEGLQELSVRGFNAQESMQALGGALDLAAGGNISVSDASIATAAAIRVFGLSTEDATFAADRMLRITNNTALQANDLAISMGNISRGAIIARQGLNEMLPAIGLVRNSGVEASVASSAVSSALIFMARRADQFQQRLGVSVTDAQGNFRNFLDIVLEARDALGQRFPNTAQRAAEAVDLFGRFGVTAFAAIERQLATGIRDVNGNILHNAEAIAYLRNQMETAAGAAEEFRGRILDTFRGQRILLQGTLQTLAVVLGEPFARVFRPFVTAITNIINAFIYSFDALPDSLKTAVSAMIVLFGVLLTAFGGLSTVTFIVALVIPFIETLAAVFAILLAVSAPLVVAAGAVGAAFYGLFQVFQRNVAGIRDVWTKLVQRFQLGLDALRMLFSRGGFTEEMDRRLRGPLRELVVYLYRAGFRILRFARGFRSGLSIAFAAGAPAVRALLMAFRELGQALGFTLGPMYRLAKTPSDRLKALGQTVASYVVRPIIVLVDLIRMAVQWFGAMAREGRRIGNLLGPSWSYLVESFRQLGVELARALGHAENFGKLGRGSASGWDEVARDIVPMLIAGLQITFNVIGAIVRAVAWLVGVWRQFSEMYGAWTWAVSNPAQAFMASWRMAATEFSRIINLMLGYLNALISRLPTWMRGGAAAMPLPTVTPQGVETVMTGVATMPGRAVGAMAATERTLAKPPVTRQQREGKESAVPTMVARSTAALDAVRRSVEAVSRRPIQLVVDGRVLAEATARGSRTAAAQAGAPTPGFAEE